MPQTSVAVTEGIRISVEPHYVAEQSAPRAKRYVFAYTVRIENHGTDVVQLRSRHWIITDGDGRVEEVRGPGVVGQQPMLRPGEHFEYTSGCVLPTPRGEMRGTYRMVVVHAEGGQLRTLDGAAEGADAHPEEGEAFDATIAPFQLVLPYSLN